MDSWCIVDYCWLVYIGLMICYSYFMNLWTVYEHFMILWQDVTFVTTVFWLCFGLHFTCWRDWVGCGPLFSVHVPSDFDWGKATEQTGNRLKQICLNKYRLTLLVEGRCSRSGRCITNFPSMWLLQPTRRAVLCRCRACTRLWRDLHGSFCWPQGDTTSVAAGKSTGNCFQYVCKSWRRLRLHAVQKDRLSAVPNGSLEWTHSQLN